MTQEWIRTDHRHIIKRIIIKGILVLDTPTALGSGDAEGITDLILLRDSITNSALLPGTSIAGALRHYLHEYQRSYGQLASRQDLSAKLFGDLFQYLDEQQLPTDIARELKETDTQSPLIINDSISSKIPSIEIRDGVKIDSQTGIAATGAKYDLELLQAGTEFPLYFELLIDKDADETALKKALKIALLGLEKGEISIGMRKNRGYGRCHVTNWKLSEFDLRKAQDRINWLKFDHWSSLPKTQQTQQSIQDILKVAVEKDQRDRLIIKAEFKLASPLLIRSGQDLSSIEDKTACVPDVVHLSSKRNGTAKPILSGTSLAGSLRHRAERIINTLKKPLTIVEELFGYVDEKKNQARASRLIINETVIENTSELVQSRIAIDRFTGGTYHGALFNEQTIFPNQSQRDQKHIALKIELQQPKDEEIGLLLLLIKDLWTSDLALGGTISIGRGRLKGLEATITKKSPNDSEKWTISLNNDQLRVNGKNSEKLEEFVQNLSNYQIIKQQNNE